MAASASITHEALKTEARVYSVRQTPAGPLFLLWVPLSLRVQPPAPLVSRVARQRQRGSLSDTRSHRADADGILKTGFFWAARVSWPLRPGSWPGSFAPCGWGTENMSHSHRSLGSGAGTRGHLGWAASPRKPGPRGDPPPGPVSLREEGVPQELEGSYVIPSTRGTYRKVRHPLL